MSEEHPNPGVVPPVDPNAPQPHVPEEHPEEREDEEKEEETEVSVPPAPATTPA